MVTRPMQTENGKLSIAVVDHEGEKDCGPGCNCWYQICIAVGEDGNQGDDALLHYNVLDVGELELVLLTLPLLSPEISLKVSHFLRNGRHWFGDPRVEFL